MKSAFNTDSIMLMCHAQTMYATMCHAIGVSKFRQCSGRSDIESSAVHEEAKQSQPGRGQG